MPVLAINTNLPASSVPDGFIQNASQLVAKLTGKPESYVTVYVNNVNGCFAGKTEPFIYAELQSIGGFSSPNNVTKPITELFANHLGVKGPRVYVKLTNPDATHFAHNGQAFG